MEPYRPALLPSAPVWQHMRAMAEDLANAASVPEALRKRPADIALLLLVGRDVGIKPTTAINRIHVIKGRPTMAAELMRALIIERGHDCWFEDIKPCEVTIVGHRKEWPAERVTRVTWNLDLARAAGLIMDYDPATGVVTPIKDKEVWRKYTRSMLKARATSELGRDVFPDVLLGVSYTPEELDVDVNEDGEPTRVANMNEAWSGNATDAPAYQPAPQIVIDAFQAQIDAMDPDTKARLVVKWKELKLRPLKPNPEAPVTSRNHWVLAMDEIDIAAVAIEEIKATAPVEAEVIAETPRDGAGDAAEPAQEDGVTAGVPIPAERAEALVADLSPSQVVEALETFEDTPIPTAEGDQRIKLAEVLSSRVICPTCTALREGPAMKDEAHCGCDAT